MVTQNLKIIMDDRKLPDIRMVSGDVGRDIFPAVYASEDADEALDLTVYQLRVIFIKPDNTFVIHDYLDGMIEIPEQAGAVTGRGFYQIRLSKDGEEIYSGQGDFYIDDQILNDSMVESVAEVNGLQFPDDFLTSADISNYATKQYVDDAIAEIPDPLDIYSTNEHVVGTWIDGSTLYERTFELNNPARNGDISTGQTYDIAFVVSGYYILNDGNSILSPNQFLSVSNFTYVHVEKDGDIKYFIQGYSANKLVVTIRYTKPTP